MRNATVFCGSQTNVETAMSKIMYESLNMFYTVNLLL